MMKKQVTESLELARANLDQAIAGLEQIPDLDAESVGHTVHKLWIRACHCQGYRRKTRRDAMVRKPAGHGACFHVRLPAFRKNL
jgi:hypothetical protein